jgi:amidophosphoribosyltransferase
MFINTEKPHDHCGVFGIFAPKKEDASRLAYFGLLALQHRGQESAGIASSDFKKIYIHRGMGLVSQVFSEEDIKNLKGVMAVGHTRYSTAGSSNILNAQPIVLTSTFGKLAFVHNGNLANYKELKKSLMAKGHCFTSESDTEVMARAVIEAKGQSLKEKIINGIPQIKGAFSLIILTKKQLFVVRDQWGIRPLFLGRLNSVGWLVASETSTIEQVGGRVWREVQPGEILSISQKGAVTHHRIRNSRGGFCIFEYVYFSRPDSVINDQLVHLVRFRCGQLLAQKNPVKADYVISVPNSGTSAALGYSQQSGIPFHEGLIKSSYVGRTFIQPTQRIRNLGVRVKFSPMRQVLEGKDVVVVDDSIVRGTTIAQLIQMLKKQAKARRIHLRIASPPFKNICYLGIDVARYKELIAAKLTVLQTQNKLKADSLAYLSLDDLKQAAGKMPYGYCTGCFDAHYPI